MKKLLLSTIAVVLAVSCNKSFETINNEANDTFEAVFENTDSKVVLVNDKTLHWENGDKISVNGVELTATVGEDKTKANFTGGTVSYANVYKAIYPSTYSDYILPASMDYQAGKFTHIPMYASNSEKSLLFKNVFAVLKVSVSNTVTVKSIKISSDLQINGKFSMNDQFTAVMFEGAEANKTTTLNCGNVTGTDFYIPIPAGNYTGKNLKVTLTKSDDSEEFMTSNQSAEINLARNTIYSFNFRKDGTMKLSTETIEDKASIL